MMKTRLIQLVAITGITLLPLAVFAGGAGCNSKEGHGKHEMSAEAMQEFKKNHAWIFSNDADSDKAVSGHEQAEKPASDAAGKADKLVEI